jgi:hypothetical protein
MAEAQLMSLFHVADIGVNIFSYLSLPELLDIAYHYLSKTQLMITAVEQQHKFLDTLSISGIGIEVYSYLQPKELLHLSLCNRSLFTDIGSVIFNVLAHILDKPIRLVDDENGDSICITRGHSFNNKSDLDDYMVKKLDSAGINAAGASTREQSKKEAKRQLDTQSWCHLELPEGDSETVAECQFDREIDQDYAKQIVGYDDCKNVIAKNEVTYAYVKEWLCYILAQDNIQTGKWSWIINHPNMLHELVRGTGIMCTAPSGDKFEIRWERSFKVVDSVAFASNVQRRRRLTYDSEDEVQA